MLRVRTRLLLVALVATFGVAGSAPALAGSDSTLESYREYSLVRERLTSCSLDRTWHHLGSSARKRCTTYRRLYILWSAPGESYRYHVYCRTSRKCPRAPEGEPNPRSPLPADAQTFR